MPLIRTKCPLKTGKTPISHQHYLFVEPFCDFLTIFGVFWPFFDGGVGVFPLPLRAPDKGADLFFFRRSLAEMGSWRVPWKFKIFSEIGPEKFKILAIIGSFGPKKGKIPQNRPKFSGKIGLKSLKFPVHPSEGMARKKIGALAY